MPERCRAPQDGDTPLHLAARNGHTEVVVKLLTAKADKEVKNEVKWGGGGVWTRRGKDPGVRVSFICSLLRSLEYLTSALQI